MGTADSYRSYAADCVRQAENAKSPVERNVLLNVALAWIRLAHQKQAATGNGAAPHTVKDLDAVKEASAEAAKIDAKMAAKIVNLERTRPAPTAAAVQSPV